MRVAENSSHVSVLRAEHGRCGYYGGVMSLGDMKSIVWFYEGEGILENEPHCFTDLRGVYGMNESTRA